jgi:hypothetical protein
MFQSGPPGPAALLLLATLAASCGTGAVGGAPPCPAGDPQCAPCPEGPIAAAGCQCGGATRTSGACCGGRWQAVACDTGGPLWATPATWQEVNIDCHCAFPHMELMEGNEAPHMGASITHGNAGYLTYFRNFASSRFAPPPVFGSTAAQTGNVTALQFDGGVLGINVVGNVLGAAGISTTYQAHDSGPRAIYQLGAGGAGAADVAATSLVRQGNFDVVSNRTVWSPANLERPLPASLCLRARPGWWPAGSPWPWAGPDLSPMVGVLPAKERALGLAP